MRQDIIRLKFHLIGGQSIQIIMPVTDGQPVTPKSLTEFAQAMVKAENIWLGDDEKWAIAIPAMANVAMIVAEGIGDHEQI